MEQKLSLMMHKKNEFLERTSLLHLKKKLQHLDIPKGKYSIHDLIHYYIFRNFYNPAWPFGASVNQNKDWYYPFISRHFDINKIEDIFKKNKMKILKKYSPSPSADNYILKKIT